MKYFFLASALCPLVSAVWPIPSSYSSGNATFWMHRDTPINLNGNSKSTYPQLNISSGSPTSSHIVDAAVERTYRRLFQHSFVPWKFHPRNSNFEPSLFQKKFINSISLTQTGSDPANIIKPLAGEVDESYKLNLSMDGKVSITAATSIGLVRGLTSLTQLFFEHSEGGVYTPYAPVSISDAPKFAHRGLNMDVSRNYFSPKDLEKMIDAMAFNKMNRFHLHITDAQSWPLEIPSMPELAQKGAYRKGLSYSPNQLRAIQEYGSLQGVEVYIETDMPGHTSSIWYSHPELIAAFNRQPDWSVYSAEPPSGTLKLNSPAVDAFLDKLFKDILPRVAPYTSYYHTGGDEVNKQAYLLDDTVQSDDPAVLKPLMQKFIDRNHAHVRAAGLTPIVWEEMLLDWNIKLGKDVVVQTWQSDEAVRNSTAAGYKTLAGNYNYWYLDCGQGQWINFQQSSTKQFYPFTDYCSPRKNWRLMYSYDPQSGVDAAHRDLVIGGEVHIWAEQTDPVNLDRMVWPRAAAAAEVLWSGPRDAAGNNRSQVEAAPRLSDLRERLVAMGVMAEPIQMPFCLMEANQCNL